MAYEIEKISEGNVDTPLTNFPVDEDTFPRMSDVSVTLLPLVLQYNNYYQNGQLALAEQLLVSNPELDVCLHNAEKWNMIRDAIIAMQRFLLNQVDSLYNEVAQNAIGVNDNPTPEQSSIVAYSAEKVDSMIADIQSNVTDIQDNIFTQFSNVDNTADKDKSVKYATDAGNASTANTLNGLNTSVDELNFVDGVTSNIQEQLNDKQATITGAATTIAESDLTKNRALISDANGKVAVSAVTDTELGYLDGVTSNVQTQLNNKAISGHSHTPNSLGAYSLSEKTLISSDDDLNDYNTPGNYWSNSSTLSKTLANCPVTASGFTLHVEWITGATVGKYMRQTILPNHKTCLTYVRRSNDSEWGDWFVDYNSGTISSGTADVSTSLTNNFIYLQYE